jgi:hypothetical protein
MQKEMFEMVYYLLRLSNRLQSLLVGLRSDVILLFVNCCVGGKCL